MKKTLVYTTFDSLNNTWNAMEHTTGKCLFYGSIFELEDWLTRHPQYTEFKANDEQVQEHASTGKIRTDIIK
jgi:hypothetical protein